MNLLSGMVHGLEAGVKSDPAMRSYQTALLRALNVLTDANARQEVLKVDLHKATKVIDGELAAVQPMIANFISYLESKFGKRSAELQAYGIMPRRKGSQRPQEEGQAPQAAVAPVVL
ncbi:MAG: hypothetical protein HYY17_14330 [Planctomycetes bacterium]|nr:hypothetical protein [Planctomycetota bacterium]